MAVYIFHKCYFTFKFLGSYFSPGCGSTYLCFFSDMGEAPFRSLIEIYHGNHGIVAFSLDLPFPTFQDSPRIYCLLVTISHEYKCSCK